MLQSVFTVFSFLVVHKINDVCYSEWGFSFCNKFIMQRWEGLLFRLLLLKISCIEEYYVIAMKFEKALVTVSHVCYFRFC